jgi:hypothetical protein
MTVLADGLTTTVTTFDELPPPQPVASAMAAIAATRKFFELENFFLTSSPTKRYRRLNRLRSWNFANCSLLTRRQN